MKAAVLVLGAMIGVSGYAYLKQPAAVAPMTQAERLQAELGVASSRAALRKCLDGIDGGAVLRACQ